MKYASLNSTHPFRSNPDGRGKHWSRIAGNGRSLGRVQGPLQLTHEQLKPRAHASPDGARVGETRHGAFRCSGCRTNVSILVRQSAASKLAWVCPACSPRSPRTASYAAPRTPPPAPVTNARGPVYAVVDGVTHKYCGHPECGVLVDITWGDPQGHIGMLIFMQNKNLGRRMANGQVDTRNPLCFPKTKRVTLCAVHMAELDRIRATTEAGRTPFIPVKEMP